MGITQKKGDIGLGQAIRDLTIQGVHVSLPISDSLSYDLVGEVGGKLLRVQVRYSKAVAGRRIDVKLKSVWSNSTGYQVRKRQRGDFDILCVYCPDTGDCYYLSDNDFDNGTAVSLRLVEMDGGNEHRIRYAKDCRDCVAIFGRVAESG